MTTTDEELAQLISNAKLIARYGQQASRLNDDALFVAIGSASAKADLSWADQEAIDLQSEVSRAASAIEPVTVVDLFKWDPFDPSATGGPTIRQKLFKGFFVFLAFALILACAHFTIWNNRSTLLLNEITVAANELQSAIVQGVLFTWMEEAKISPDYNYAKAKSELFQTLTQIDTVSSRDSDILQRYRNAMVHFNPLASAFRALDKRLRPPTETPIYGSYAEPAATEAGAEIRRKCRESFLKLATWTSDGYDEPGELLVDLAQYKNDILESFNCIMNLDEKKLESSLFREYPRALRQHVELLGRWLLPGIYGALGAILFTMRSFLNPVVPDPKPATVMLRVFLGAFAGIIVGWFWTSDSSSSVQLIPNISLGLLTVAFLFGFAIDVFFALLDRAVQAASSAASRIELKTPNG